MYRKYLKYAIGVIAIFLVVKFIILIVNSYSKLVPLNKSTSVDLPKITNTYLNIFPNADTTLIKPSYTYFNKLKNPIATFQISKGQYDLLVYKIDNVESPASLSKVIQARFDQKVKVTNDLVYDASYKNNYIRFGDAVSKPKAGKHIYLNFDGTLTGKPVINDSLAYYKVNINGFSGQYDLNGIVDFYVKPRTVLSKKVETNLVFYKKDHNVYMALFFPNQSHNGHNDEVIFNLFKLKK